MLVDAGADLRARDTAYHGTPLGWAEYSSGKSPYDEIAAYLREQGLKPTFAHLRLAYLLGGGGAAKVLRAPPQTPLAGILGAAVIRANPFMKGMTAAGLVERSARDVVPRSAAASS